MSFLRYTVLSLIALSSLPRLLGLPVVLGLLGVVGCADHASSLDASAPTDASAISEDAATPADLAMAPDGGAGDLGPDGGAVDAGALLAARPYTLTVPSGYSAAVPTPLLLMIHGYNSDAAMHEAYFQLAPLAESAGFLYARADGTRDIAFKRGWNATDACCFFQPDKPDDLTYLTVVLDDVVAKYNVDPKRVFILGHSNGGFMTNRLACELSPRIAAVVSFAGAVWKNPLNCPATSPVSYLQLHADNDPTIAYAGGKIFFLGAEYPSAHETVATWASKNGCATGLLATGLTHDLASTAPGAETTVEAYSGCAAGSAVELWTLTGIPVADSPHQPPMNATLASVLWGFLASHPKP